jgi:hypothetical protein
VRGIARERRKLQKGAFAGRTACTWFDNKGANLVVVGLRFAAYVTGSLTRQELYSLAEGLRQR